jgi:hypothetical protein
MVAISSAAEIPFPATSPMAKASESPFSAMKS